jgi:hypothetical protein
MRIVLRFVLVAVFGWVVQVPGSAHAGAGSPTWSIGLGGSVASPYNYLNYSRTIPNFNIVVDYDLSFDRTWMASLSVGRRLGGSTWLQTGFDYFTQEDPSEGLSVRMGCSAVGVRYEFDPDERARPYVELLPALFIGRWTSELTHESATNPRPGVTAGIGLVGPVAGRISLDVGIKGYLSADWPSVGYPLGRPDYDGVKRWTLGGKVLYGF